MRKLAETAIVVMGLFSVWIWVAFVGVNSLSSKPSGYVVGELCVWDAVMLALVAIGGGPWVARWPAPRRAAAISWTAVSYIGLVAFVFLAGHPAGDG